MSGRVCPAEWRLLIPASAANHGLFSFFLRGASERGWGFGVGLGGGGVGWLGGGGGGWGGGSGRWRW